MLPPSAAAAAHAVRSESRRVFGLEGDDVRFEALHLTLVHIHA
jgi:hypothetical protein